jgi:hypothetical protein
MVGVKWEWGGTGQTHEPHFKLANRTLFPEQVHHHVLYSICCSFVQERQMISLLLLLARLFAQ